MLSNNQCLESTEKEILFCKEFEQGVINSCQTCESYASKFTLNNTCKLL